MTFVFNIFGLTFEEWACVFVNLFLSKGSEIRMKLI